MPIVGLTLDSARDAVGSFAETAWKADGTYGSVPITWGNIQFDPDSDTSRDVGYVEMTFLPGDSVQTGTSGGSSGVPWRQTGIVQFDIYGPEGVGEVVPLAMAQVLSSALAGEDISGVQLRGPDVKPFGPTPEGWYRLVLTFDFFYNYFKT